MERRKNTPYQATKLPREYLGMVENVFNKNFETHLKKSEKFVSFGELFPDEVIVVVSLSCPGSLQMTTCYASVDYPPATPTGGIPAVSNPAKSSSAVESVEISVNQCVDGIASFFKTFFDEGRPVDYDTEYRQTWTQVKLDKNVKVFLRINRDNPELDQKTEAFLKNAEKEKKYH